MHNVAMLIKMHNCITRSKFFTLIHAGAVIYSSENKVKIPGVNNSNRWFAVILRIIWAMKRINALMIIFLIQSVDLETPHPNKVTKRGAARPPIPPEIIPIGLVEDTLFGCQVAAA